MMTIAWISLGLDLELDGAHVPESRALDEEQDGHQPVVGPGLAERDGEAVDNVNYYLGDDVGTEDDAEGLDDSDAAEYDALGDGDAAKDYTDLGDGEATEADDLGNGEGAEDSDEATESDEDLSGEDVVDFGDEDVAVLGNEDVVVLSDGYVLSDVAAVSA